MIQNAGKAISWAKVCAIVSLFCFGNTCAQSLTELAFPLPVLASKHIAVGQFENARVGVYNGCTLPVDVEVRVTPYAPDGVARLDHAPYTIALTIHGQGFGYGDVALGPTADNVAHADIEIAPAPIQGENHTCFAPGQDLIRAAIGVYSSIDGSVRNVFPVKFQGPSPRSATASGIIRPLHDRVIVRQQEEQLIPVNPGDILQIAAANHCATAEQVTGAILVVSNADGPMPVNIDLEPGERKVISWIPVAPEAPAVEGGYWLLLSPLSPGGHKACLADNISVGLIYQPLPPGDHTIE